MTTASIQRPDALFQCQETLINLCTLHTPLAIVALAVGSSLRASQIDEQEFTLCLSVPTVLDLDLANGV